MKMEKDSLPTNGLEDFFEAGRQARSEVDPDLLARILQDAEEAQPAPVTLGASRSSGSSARGGFWQLFGGWPSAGLLTACLVAGVSLGYSTPENLGSLTETILSSVGLDASGNYSLSLDGLLVEG